ncbi:MAG: energy transducer TonB [Pseudomonadota bacterium]
MAENSQPDTEKKGRSSDTLLLILALLAIAGMGAWFFLGTDEQMIEEVPIATPIDDLEDPVTAVVAVEEPTNELLNRARLAANAGMLVEPAGTNALYYYSLYLEEQGADSDAEAELQEILGRIGSDVDQAIDAGDFDRAGFLVDQIRNAGLTHESVTNYQNQVADFADTLRSRAIAAAEAGDETQIETLLAQYEALPGVNSTALLALRSDVRDALDAQRLAAAAAAAEAQRRREQQQAAARQRAANQQAAAARRQAATPATIPASPAEDPAVVAVRAALNDGDLTSAASLFADVPSDNAERGTLQVALDTQLARGVSRLASAGQTAEAEAMLNSWRSVADDASTEAALTADIDAAYIRAATADIVSAATLRRLETLAPVYPRAAIRRGLSGRLRLEYTVDVDGTTRDIEVVDSPQNGIFDRSAIRAVSGWRYEPREVRGQAVAQRVFAFLDYNLE